MVDVTSVRRSMPVAARDRARRCKARGKVTAHLCVAATLLVSGCDQGAASDPTQTPVVVGRSSPAPGGGDGTASGVAANSASPPQAPPSQPGSVAIPDGRSAAILTKVDLQAGTVTLDPVVVLTGDAMKKYLKSHPDAADPYYNPDYIVIDDNPALQTLPLAATATVRVIDLDSGNNSTHAIRLADLPAHLNTSGYHEQDGRSAFPYYLTVLHGQVTGLQELGVA